jgi:hypothetical protein
MRPRSEWRQKKGDLPMLDILALVVATAAFAAAVGFAYLCERL